MKLRHHLRNCIWTPIPQTGGDPEYLTMNRDDLVKIEEIVSDKPASREHPRIEIRTLSWFISWDATLLGKGK